MQILPRSLNIVKPKAMDFKCTCLCLFKRSMIVSGLTFSRIISLTLRALIMPERHILTASDVGI